MRQATYTSCYVMTHLYHYLHVHDWVHSITINYSFMYSWKVGKSKMSPTKDNENGESNHEDTEKKKTLGGIKTMPFILGMFLPPFMSLSFIYLQNILSTSIQVMIQNRFHTHMIQNDPMIVCIFFLIMAMACEQIFKLKKFQRNKETQINIHINIKSGLTSQCRSYMWDVTCQQIKYLQKII